MYNRSRVIAESFGDNDHADWEKARSLIDTMDLDSIFYGSDIDCCWQTWKTAFLDIMGACISRARLPDKINPPWSTKHILQLIRKRNLLYKKAKGNKSCSFFIKFKRMRSKICTLLCSSKRWYYQNLKSKNSKAFWKVVALKKNKRAIPTLMCGGKVISDEKEKADVLNNQLIKNFNLAFPPLCDLIYDTIPPDFVLDGFECSEDEVFKLLATIDISKANGPDDISGRMLKETALGITPAITRIFNLSLQTGTLPMEWKTARVSPIPKSSETSDPANYRPISLLCILS